MTAPTKFVTASEAAKTLGVSVKALRIYEERGLIAPARTAAGWRAYGPEDLSRAAKIAALRGLGFSLAQVARVLDRERLGLEQALADHQATLEDRRQQITAAIERLHSLRQDLAGGHPASADGLRRLTAPAKEPVAAFDLPWPWGGERFELRDLRALTYIVGPLFSGKTKLAQRLAETLPNGAFLGLERLDSGGAAAHAQMAADPALASRVERALAWLTESGATRSDALLALLAGLEADGPGALVIDMIEQDLDAASQQALIAYLRRRGAEARPLFAMTRSCEILDLETVGPHEAIILCPANHSPPLQVDPTPGAPGYEAVATCLAPPAARIRTAGVVAYRPPAA